MYLEITQGIEVAVEPEFLPEESSAELSQYVFAYKIRITNRGDLPATLVTRRWTITDGAGQVHQVQGPGVVGQTPRLEPGQSFQYSSFCPLPTPTGNMRGSYEMKTDDGNSYQIAIPLFFLRDLRAMH